MTINKASNFLGTTSYRYENDLFSISIVNYSHFVSEDWHYHEQFHLSSILIGGNRESRKKADIQVKPGKIMTYREGEVHRNRNTVFPSKNLNVEISPKFFNDDIKLSNLYLDNYCSLSLLKVYHELLLNDVYSSQSVQQLLESCFYKGVLLTKPDWINTINTVLQDRWQEFVSLDELSSELGLHPVTISKTFSKHANCTLADYMRKLKVERAINMILNSTDSLTEIAYQCGFSDQSHMTRLFKHYIGFNPKNLRKI
ncbi:AraC family transcriptional regulator [Winogradskyella sp.]|uniref:helix-turn-helix domain-containing protein n=1 Tax=Winogradskyella sp. TaxID=1883156 RepID=UPI0026135BFF|nr:AraC family transcriptional regulator [Winogradskyella sp.]